MTTKKMLPHNVAVHTKTCEEFDNVVEYLEKDSDRLGQWHTHKEESCVRFGEMFTAIYGTVQFYKQRGYTIISYQDFVKDYMNSGSLEQKESVGDINSNEKGSGARYNAGKPDYSMLLLSDFAEYIANTASSDFCDLINILCYLGDFQKTHNVKNLKTVLDILGDEAIEESTHVFTYGASKYKKFNWMKGMQWSIPLACAVRHIMAIINGEEVDAESGRKHSAHVVCNVFMLIHYTQYYKEGNDLPPKELFEE